MTVKIYNILGQEVSTLHSGYLPVGAYQYEWDASNMASGIYLYRLETNKFSETKKMLLVR